MDEIHLADLGLRTLKILVEREPVVIDGTALEAKSSDRLNFTDFLLKCDLDDYVFFVPSPIACKYPLADIALEGKAAYEVTFSADGSLGSRLYGVHTSDKVRNVVNAAKASNVHRLSVSALHCAATIAAASNKVMHTVSKSLADCETVHRALVSNGLKKVKPKRPGEFMDDLERSDVTVKAAIYLLNTSRGAGEYANRGNHERR